MTKHTQGPWWFDQDTGEITCEAREGKVEIATVEIGWAPAFEAEQQANARLIAAAPELLEALKEAMGGYTEFSVGDRELLRKCRATIAKAEGATQ